MSKVTRDATGYDDAKLGELLNLAGIVRHEAHGGNAEVAEDVANLKGFTKGLAFGAEDLGYEGNKEK